MVPPRVTATMKDVARVANVSQSTVSHVLNKTRKVSPETERAVLDAVALVGYSGDGVARSLRTGSTLTVGLAIAAISNPYFADVVHAIEPRIAEAGYSLLLADTHDDPEFEGRVVREFLSRRVDAMIIAPSANAGPSLGQLSRRGVPAVLIDRLPPDLQEGWDAVGTENYESTASLVDHLAEHGHQRIALVTSHPGLSTTGERTAGYTMGLARHGLTSGQDLIRAGDDGEHDPGKVTDEAIRDLLSLADPPTAIVLGNNKVGIEAIRALQKLKLRIPEDIAVAMFDDFPWSDLFRPRMTAMSQPLDELGAQAVSMLLGRLAGDTTPPRQLRLRPTLRIRESCGCSGADA